MDARYISNRGGLKSAGLVVLIALLSAALAIAGYRYVDNRDSNLDFLTQDQTVKFVSDQTPSESSAGNPDFVQAAAAVIPAVVHIKTTFEGRSGYFYDFFGARQAPILARGSGSGVLITPDGYIVTNNHVIENATSIEVILPDKRSLEAELIGRDPNTDLALVKVKGDRFPVVPLGNSDDVQVGEWVLAVGYPYSLNSTVTAGIVSAKGRSIGILNRPSQRAFADPSQNAPSTAIESFIQTDAAINSGNSGGALVNTDGQLIGINAAIASQTGSYAGYGFAIPVNLMRKVVSDFRRYGKVRRGYLGISFPVPTVEDQVLRELGIDPAEVEGVYVLGVQPESGAAAAGLKEGDIIKSIDGARVLSSSELAERIARHQPGDKVQIAYLRDGRTREVEVTLKGEDSEMDTADKSGAAKGLQAKLGASFAPLPDRIKEQYRLNAGVYVTEVVRGGLFDLAGIPKGTIITSINGRPVSTFLEVDKAVSASQSGMVRIEGIAPDGTGFVFSFPLGT